MYNIYRQFQNILNSPKWPKNCVKQIVNILNVFVSISAGEEIAGVEYGPESLQGMRENLERVLQFMAHKRIRMHSITSKELLEGNLKSVMRLILALAAHYKPQSVKHHNMSGDSLGGKTGDTEVAGGRLAPGQTESRNNPISSSSNTAAENSWRAKGPVAKDNIGEPGENPRKWKKPAAAPGGSNSIDSPRQSVETQTALSAAHAAAASAAAEMITPRSIGPSPVASTASGRGLKDESFSRSGSGRKLPQIPPVSTADSSSSRVRCNTLPSRRPGDNDEEEEDGGQQRTDEDGLQLAGSKTGNKPKALEFWESMENIERSDFRYNTIHRMSVGRRQLPKPPGSGSNGEPPHHHMRSQSIDNGGSEAGGGGGGHHHHQPCSLNSSFSGPSSLPIHSAPHSPRLPMKKMPPDGASLQSSSADSSQEDAEVISTASASRRGEVEGSSDKNSPPTSLVQGVGGGNAYHHQSGGMSGEKGVAAPNPAYEWVRGSFDHGQRKKWGLPSPIFLGGGNGSNGVAGVPGMLDAAGSGGEKAVPYTVLLQELMQAKKQLQELYQLVRILGRTNLL